ncbi:alpha-1,2-fucosyltransferase [Shewanella sp.]|uniref:alpha-1,2-fucosyltransferase n=1 Tax=Shewanella sp. TaxID=50422 RepID=UPI003D0F8421
MSGKIIIEIVGGLGNQMFQYALYLKMIEIYGKERVYIYIGRFEKTNDNKGFQLEKYFKQCKPNIYNGDVSQYIDDNRNLISKFRRKIFGFKKTYILEVSGNSSKDLNALECDKNYYIRGLWQSEKFFVEIKDIVRGIFSSFTNDSNEKWNLLVNNKKNIVSMHVRRGDYISNPKYYKLLGGVCDKNYYINAVDYMKNNLTEHPVFFIFSDDIEWVRKEFDFLKKYDVIFSKNNSDIEDIYFMSKCDAHIIANSTFSWWGAWLGSNKNKLVVSPKNWFKGHTSEGIVPEIWTRL